MYTLILILNLWYSPWNIVNLKWMVTYPNKLVNIAEPCWNSGRMWNWHKSGQIIFQLNWFTEKLHLIFIDLNVYHRGSIQGRQLLIPCYRKLVCYNLPNRAGYCRYRPRTKETEIEKDNRKLVDLSGIGISSNYHRYQTGSSLSGPSFYTDRDCQWRWRHRNRRWVTCDIGLILLCLWHFTTGEIGSCSGSGIPFCVLDRSGIRQREFHHHRNELQYQSAS